MTPEAERSMVADWMLLRGYTIRHGDTVQDLLFDLEAQVTRGGPPEPPPGEGDFKLLQAQVARLRNLIRESPLLTDATIQASHKWGAKALLALRDPT